MVPKKVQKNSINAIRFLAADAVERAKSGHPGMPMGAAPMAYVLWTEFLKHNPKDPKWPGRDRFVLSCGHGSMLLYALLHLTGYDLSIEDIKEFRQWGSKTPGHPEYGHTPGVEITTGPLGQGISTAVGFALAEKKLAAEFNREGYNIIDHYTYVIASDGDIMEGVTYESCSLAGHWKLGKLIVLYDDNKITIDGSTDLAFTEDVLKRYEAFGWHTLKVDSGEDLDSISNAIKEAKTDPRPSIIAIRSNIGYGTPKQDSPDSHGSPLGEEAIKAAREKLEWPYPPFEIPQEVYDHFRQSAERGIELQKKWEENYGNYRREYPELAAELERRLKGVLPKDISSDAIVSQFKPGDKIATRAASGKILNILTENLSEIIGGSADLTPSNNTKAKGTDAFSSQNPKGRYIHFGIREHGMGAVLNGINLHGGFRAYGGTFLVFSDYMRPAIRLAALMKVPTIFVYTHDSIALGEDGPTHQPIEQTMSLRLIPNLWVVRPMDAFETVYAWDLALNRLEGPTALILTRQGLPAVDRNEYASAEGLLKGGYVISNTNNPKAVIIASGSEVELALKSQKRLLEEGINTNVVSMPCWEAFDEQTNEYRQSVLPADIPKIAVEAGISIGWERYADDVIGLSDFGCSAPYPEVYEKLGFNVDNVVKRVKNIL